MTVNRLHAYAEMVNMEENQYADFKFKFLHPQRGPSGETYEQYPRRNVDGKHGRVTRLRVGPPPQDIWAEYQDRKAEFKDELYDETIEGLEDDGESDEETPADVAEAIRKNGGHEQYIREINGGTQRVLDSDLIKAEHDLSVRKAKHVKKLLIDELDDDKVI
jgi:hypothetical protein